MSRHTGEKKGRESDKERGRRQLQCNKGNSRVKKEGRERGRLLGKEMEYEGEKDEGRALQKEI